MASIEHDLHRNTLDDLGEIAGGVSGGSRLNCEPLAGEMLSTWPVTTTPGKVSTVMLAGWPIATRVSCVSLKLATTHTVSSGTTEITCTPGRTYCPVRTPRSPTMPSTGDTMRV